MKKNTTPIINEFLNMLSKDSKQLIEEYIEYEYQSKVRTGRGKKLNFLKEHDSLEGIKIVKEILRFKRLVKRKERDEHKGKTK